MNIALIAEDGKKDLMVQFCIAYCGILSQHHICATGTTGRIVSEATGMKVDCYLSYDHGGIEQIGALLSLNEIDMVLFFKDPGSDKLLDDLNFIAALCDSNNIPFATNIATAEVLVQGLHCGDLDWRMIVNPKYKTK